MGIIRNYEKENDPRQEFQDFATEDADISVPTPVQPGPPLDPPQPVIEPPQPETPVSQPQTTETVNQPVPNPPMAEEPPSPGSDNKPISDPQTGQPYTFSDLPLDVQAENPNLSTIDPNKLTIIPKPGGDAGYTPSGPTINQTYDEYLMNQGQLINDQMAFTTGLAHLTGEQYPTLYELPDTDRQASELLTDFMGTMRTAAINQEEMNRRARESIVEMPKPEDLDIINKEFDFSEPSTNYNRDVTDIPGVSMFSHDFDFNSTDEEIEQGMFGQKPQDNRSFKDKLIGLFVGNGNDIGEYGGGIMGSIGWLTSIPDNAVNSFGTDLYQTVRGRKNPYTGDRPFTPGGSTLIGTITGYDFDWEPRDMSLATRKTPEKPFSMVGSNLLPETFDDLRNRSILYNFPLVRNTIDVAEFIANRFLNPQIGEERGTIPGFRQLQESIDEMQTEGKPMFDLSGLEEFAERSGPEIQLPGGFEFSARVLRPSVVRGLQGLVNFASERPLQTGEFLAALGAEASVGAAVGLPFARALGAAGAAVATSDDIIRGISKARKLNQVLTGADDLAQAVPRTVRMTDDIIARSAADVSADLSDDVAQTAARNVPETPNVRQRPVVRTPTREIDLNTGIETPRSVPGDFDQVARAAQTRATTGQIEEAVSNAIERGLDYTPAPSQILPSLQNPPQVDINSLIRSKVPEYTTGRQILNLPEQSAIIPAKRPVMPSELTARAGLNTEPLSIRQLRAMSGDIDGPLFRYADPQVTDLARRQADYDDLFPTNLADEGSEAIDVRATEVIDEEKLFRQSDPEVMQRRAAVQASDVGKLDDPEVQELLVDFSRQGFEPPNNPTDIIKYQVDEMPRNLWARSEEGIEETAKYLRNTVAAGELAQESVELQFLYKNGLGELQETLRRIDDLPDLGRHIVYDDIPFIPNDRNVGYRTVTGNPNYGGQYVRPAMDYGRTANTSAKESLDQLKGAGATDALAAEVNQMRFYHGTKVDLPQPLDGLDPIQGGSRSPIGTVIHTSNEKSIGALYANVPSNKNLPKNSVRTSVRGENGVDLGPEFVPGTGEGAQRFIDGDPYIETTRKTFNENGIVYELQPQVKMPLDVDAPLGDEVNFLAGTTLREVPGLVDDARLRGRIQNTFKEGRSLTEIYDRIDKVLAEEFSEFPEQLALDIQRHTTAVLRDSFGVDALVKRGDYGYLEVGFTGVPGRQKQVGMLSPKDFARNTPEVPDYYVPRESYFAKEAADMTASLYPNSTYAKVNSAEALARYQVDQIQSMAQRLDNSTEVYETLMTETLANEKALKRLNLEEEAARRARKAEVNEAKTQRLLETYNKPEEGIC